MEAFEKLKMKLVESTVLAFPDVTQPFILQTDASQTGAAAVLSQINQNGEERVVAFTSYMLKPAEQRYHATERELLAVVIAVKKFRAYLDGQTFTLRTDNKALVWLNKMKDVNSRLVRWALLLQEFSFTVEHIPGKDNIRS